MDSDRRAALRKLGAGALLALAGCSGDAGDPATTASGRRSTTATAPTTTAAKSRTTRTTTPTTATESSTTDPPTARTPDPTVTPASPDLAAAEWAVTFEGSPGAPAHADGYVFVGTDAGALYALDAATGEQEWSVAVEQGVQDGPVVADGTVYWVTGQYGLGGTPTAMGVPLSGGEPWTVPHRAPSGSRATLSLVGASEDGVYLGTSDDVIDSSGESLYALAPDGRKRWVREVGDRATGRVGPGGVYVGTWQRVDAFGTGGERRWTLEFLEPRVAAVGTDRVYLDLEDRGFGNRSLRAVDAATGEEHWRIGAWQARSATAVDGAVYVGGERLARLDPATGEAVWTVDRSGSVPRETVPVADGTLYAGGDTVAAYAVADGTREWSVGDDATDYRVEGLTGGTVLVGAGRASLVALERATGRKRWRVDGDSSVAVGGGRAFVTVGGSLAAVPV